MPRVQFLLQQDKCETGVRRADERREIKTHCSFETRQNVDDDGVEEQQVREKITARQGTSANSNAPSPVCGVWPCVPPSLASPFPSTSPRLLQVLHLVQALSLIR